MSGQNEFAERLKRIEARQGGRPEQPSLDSLPPLGAPGGGGGNGGGAPTGGGGGSGFGPVRMALVLLVILGMFGAGGLYIVNSYGKEKGETVASKPKEPRNTSARSAEPEDVPLVLTFTARWPKTDPKAPPASLGDVGWTLQPGLVANAARAELQVSAVASGYDPAVPDLVPGSVEMFDPNGECTLRKPAPGEVVHNVRLERGTGLTELHVVSDEAVATALTGHIKGLMKNNDFYKGGKAAAGRMDRVDVFVTDTSGPVYLALQNISGNTLWNIHRGPGVQIAHVALIGNTPGAILPSGNIPIEALRISDFVESHEFGAYDQIEPCMIRPFRSPEPHWPTRTKAADGNTLYVNQLHTFSTGFASFNDWYTRTLGLDADTNVVAGVGAAHVLVGPVPAGQLGYNRIEGREVRLVRAERVFRSDEALIEAHVALLTAATGGDPMSLDPAPMERVTQ